MVWGLLSEIFEPSAAC